MVCPACGYSMRASDTDCPRCHGKGLASPEATAVPEATVTPVEAARANVPPGSGAVPGSGMGSSAPPGAPAATDDQPSFVMALVGFLVPLAGLIIYLVMRGQKPLSARSAGRGAALGFGMGLASMLVLLPAILFPVFARARENARRAECQHNLQQMNLAAFQYFQDNNGALPDLSSPASIRAALAKYAGGRDVFKCPAGHEYQGNPSLSGTRFESVQNPASTVLFSEPAGVHLDGHNEGFVDGHVKWFRDR